MLHPLARAGALALAALVTACATGGRVQTDVPLAVLQTRAAQDSADAVAQYNLAIGYWSQSSFEQAREALLSATRIDPRFAEAYLALGFLPFAQRPSLWQERFEGRVPAEWQDALIEADRNYERAMMINPLVDMRILGAVTPPQHWAWTVGGLSSAYEAWFQGFDDYRNGNYEAAFGRYDRLIAELEIEWRRDARERMPDAILLHRGLAAAHLERWDIAVTDIRIVYDRYRSAEEDEDQLIHIPLETNNYRYILAVLLEASGAATEAEALLREAASADLGLYMAHVRLANIAEARGDGALALEERQRAIAANPDDPTLHLERGLTLANVGRLPESIESLETAIRLNPRDAQAHYFLGLVHSMAGDDGGSRRALETFLELAPERMFQERAEAQARLAGMR